MRAMTFILKLTPAHLDHTMMALLSVTSVSMECIAPGKQCPSIKTVGGTAEARQSVAKPLQILRPWSLMHPQQRALAGFAMV